MAESTNRVITNRVIPNGVITDSVVLANAVITDCRPRAQVSDAAARQAVYDALAADPRVTMKF
jgi:hypothetical protein